MSFANRTYVALETLTASIMNTYIRDSLEALQDCGLIFKIGDVTGPVISTGTRNRFLVPKALTLVGWTIIGDASGSIVVDIKKATYANFPTTSSIAGTEKPTLTAQQKNQDLALGTWTTSIASGDVVECNVESASTVREVFVTLHADAA